MPSPLVKRLTFWKDIYYGKVRVGVALFITISTVILSIRDLLIAPEYRNFALLKYVPQWPWYIWVLTGAVGLLLLTLEGSYSKFQRDQIRFRSAYRAKSKAAKSQHRSDLVAARVHGLTQPHQSPLTLLPSVKEVSPPTPTIAGQAPPEARELPRDHPVSIDDSGRIILNVTAEYLVGIYQEYTNVQADKLIEAYIEKWLRVSGKVLNVTSSRVYVGLHEAPREALFVVAVFHERKWVDHIATFRRGTQIEMLGKIVEVDRDTIQLTECELTN